MLTIIVILFWKNYHLFVERLGVNLECQLVVFLGLAHIDCVQCSLLSSISIVSTVNTRLFSVVLFLCKFALFFLQSILPKDEGFNGFSSGIVAQQQSTLPHLGVGYKQNTYGTTLPKIPVATTTHTTTFPTSFPSIIHQEKNKVKVSFLKNVFHWL